MAGISLTLPLWSGKYRAVHVTAQELRHSAILRRADRVNQLTARLEMLAYRVRDTQRQGILYRESLIPKARQSLVVTRTGFEAGTQGFMDLIDAQRVLLEFELNYHRIRTRHLQHLAELEMLVGEGITVADPEEQKNE
jgi:outer membrane protein TolC